MKEKRKIFSRDFFDTQINWLTLGFFGILEKEFRDYYYAEVINQYRVILLICIFTYGGSIISDRLLLPDKYHQALLIRWGLVCSTFFCIFLLTFRKNFHKYFQLSIGVGSIVGTLGIYLIMFLYQDKLTWIYYANLAPIIIIVSTIARVRFVTAVICTGIILATYPPAAFLLKTPLDRLIASFIYLGIFAIFGNVACYCLEYSERKNFYLSKLFDQENRKVEEANLKLEKRVEERTFELRESEKKYKGIFENIQDVYFELDVEGNILEISPSVYQLTLYTRDELLGKSFQTIMESEYHIENFISAIHLAKKNKVTDYEIIVTSKQGYQKFATIVAVKINGTGTSKIVGSLHDIDHQKQVEQTLRDSEQFKTEIVSIVNHELRTPLNLIQMGLSTIKSGMRGNLSPEIRDDINISYEGVTRLKKILDDLLTLDQNRLHRLKLNLKKMSVKKLIGLVIEETTDLISRHKHTLHNEIPEDISYIYADQEKMYHIMVNLLTNSIKYTPEGGQIFIYGVSDQKNIAVSIVDNGVGVPKWAQDKIFNRFFQADKTLSAVVGGSGLGLSIVKDMIELHKGSIKCVSPLPVTQFPKLDLNKNRKGCLFEVILPIHRLRQRPDLINDL